MPITGGHVSGTSRQDGVVVYSRLEMERDYDGFYHQISLDNMHSGFNMGYLGSIK